MSITNDKRELIIDTHGHIQDHDYPAGSTLFVDAGMMVDALDRHGIAEIWVSPVSAMVRGSDCAYHNKKQYEQFKKPYPDRFRNYAVFSPYYGNEMREDIKRCFEEYGFEAIKIHSWVQGFGLHQPAMYEIMEAAVKYDVPVMFHDGTPPYADTLQIASLAQRYPESKVLLGHAGLYDSYRSAIQACNAHDNVWLILIGPITGDMREILRDARHDRLLFGTDYCCAGDGWVGESIIVDRINIIKFACPDKELYDLIMYKNAQTLMGII